MKLLIFACHPVSYQLPLFLAIQTKFGRNSHNVKTVFLDDMTLRKTFHKDINGFLEIDAESYLANLNHCFSHNFSNALKGGYFSRFNIDIIPMILKSDIILIYGYEFFSYFIILIACSFQQEINFSR